MSDEDKAEGLKLGRHPDLAGEILRDVEKLGLVGEQTNKLMGYLAMTSRKMDDPLALLILSGSGAGKSLLQDTLLQLCPGRRPDQAHVADRPGLVLQGRGRAEKQGAGAGGSGRGRGGAITPSAISSAPKSWSSNPRSKIR